MIRRLAHRVCALALVLAASTGSAQTGDYCNRPWPIVIPDGSSVSKEELLKIQRAVKKYMEGGDAYIACLKREEALVPADPYQPNAVAEAEAVRARKHNAMIDEMELVAARFNAAVEAHKAAHGGG